VLFAIPAVTFSTRIAGNFLGMADGPT